MGIIITLGLYGCNLQKKSAGTFQETTEPAVIMERNRIQNKGIERMWIKRYNGELHHETYTQKIRGHIRIVKDSIIILTMGSSLGVEAVRIYMTKDTVTIINRMQKTYYHEPVERLQQELGSFVGYGFIQDLLLMHYDNLTGHILEHIPKRAFRKMEENPCIRGMEETVYKSTNMPLLILEEVCFDTGNGDIARLEYTGPGQHNHTRVVYETGPGEKNTRLLRAFAVDVKQNGTELAGLRMEMTKISVNEPFPTKMSIGTRYSRVYRMQYL